MIYQAERAKRDRKSGAVGEGWSEGQDEGKDKEQKGDYHQYHRTHSVVASYKPSMLVTGVRFPVCAFSFVFPIDAFLPMLFGRWRPHFIFSILGGNIF